MHAADYDYFGGGFMAMAHRGGPGLPVNHGKENTLFAFRNAWQLGYRHLETDVHLTRDGQLVAFHDDHLERVTGRPGGVAQHSWAELQQVTVGGEPIPLMSELFEALPDARFNIDLKVDGTETALSKLIDQHQARDRVCVGSFDQARLGRFRRLVGTRVATSCGPRETTWMMRPLGLNRLLTTAGVALQVPEHHRVAGRSIRVVSPGFIRRAHRVGKQVQVWTVDDPNDMHRLIDWGVDGLISDAIDVLKSVVQERGLWPNSTSQLSGSLPSTVRRVTRRRSHG